MISLAIIYSSCTYSMYYDFVYQANREDQESDVGVNNAVAEGSSASSGDVDDSFDGKETDKESKKKKNRCAVCRKKVGLTGKCHVRCVDSMHNNLKTRANFNLLLTDDECFQVSSAVVEDCFALCIGTATNTIANLITKKWALKKFGATIQLLLVKKCKKFELFSV